MLPNLLETTDLVTFTKEIPNGKLLFFVHCNFHSPSDRQKAIGFPTTLGRIEIY